MHLMRDVHAEARRLLSPEFLVCGTQGGIRAPACAVIGPEPDARAAALESRRSKYGLLWALGA